MKLENDEIIRNMDETKDAVEGLGNKFKDEKFMEDLATKEPARLTYDKLLSKKNSEKSFIMHIIPNNKDVIKYMAPSLKEDEGFLTQVVKTYPEALGEVLKNCNVKTDEYGNIVLFPEKIEKENNMINQAITGGTIDSIYANNEKFMSAAIAKDAGMVLLLSEGLKNDKTFIKTECMKNSEVLNTIVENADEFGIDGLGGAKEANTEMSLQESLEDFQTRLAELKENLAAQGLNEEEINFNNDVKRLVRHCKTMQKHLDKSPEEQQRLMNGLKKRVKNKSEKFQKSCNNDTVLGNAITKKIEISIQISVQVGNVPVSHDGMDDDAR